MSISSWKPTPDPSGAHYVSIPHRLVIAESKAEIFGMKYRADHGCRPRRGPTPDRSGEDAARDRFIDVNPRSIEAATSPDVDPNPDQQRGVPARRSGRRHWRPIENFHAAYGAGVRVDTAATGAGYKADPAFDSLLAKVIVTAPSYQSAVSLAQRSLAGFSLTGIETNKAFLAALISHPSVVDNTNVHTRFVEEKFNELHENSKNFKSSPSSPSPSASDATKQEKQSNLSAPPGQEALEMPMAGIIADLPVKEGDVVEEGKRWRSSRA
ncbi:hypothetical protein L7F22_069022 [Adiantum nelumboides]|nr:hypothetical protein [Adiantum nelumboides]